MKNKKLKRLLNKKQVQNIYVFTDLYKNGPFIMVNKEQIKRLKALLKNNKQS